MYYPDTKFSSIGKKTCDSSDSSIATSTTAVAMLLNLATAVVLNLDLLTNSSTIV